MTGAWEALSLSPPYSDMEAFYKEALDPDGAGSNPLKELECEPEATDKLIVDTAAIEATGGILVCDRPDPDNTPPYDILAPNKCILLCDYHLGMTIEGVLDDNGDYTFKIVELDEDNIVTQENVNDKIKCW